MDEGSGSSMLDKRNGLSKIGLVNILGKWKTLRKLILFFKNISGELVIFDHLMKFWFNL